ncbi:MAG: hypothetical protein IKW14_03210 [Phascolarctobacterium sp.]|nr:hypothetical protein [Phascolarctobacterium sp.]
MLEVKEQYMVAVAEFRFGCNNIFEDIIAGQKSWHLNNFSLVRGFDFFPLPIDYKIAIEHKKQFIQKQLDEHADGCCKSLNELDRDVQYKRVHLDCLDRIHSAAVRYQRIGTEYKAQSMMVWYITEGLELEGFLESDIEKNFPFLEVKDDD